MNNSISTPPAIHEIGPMTLEDYHTITLPNGIQLHTLSGGEADVCRVMLCLPGGETESPVPGLYGITGALLIEGTESRSGEEIADALDFNGAWWGNSMSTHYTCLTINTLCSKLEPVMRTAVDMISHSMFPQEAVTNHLQMLASRLAVEQRKVSVIAANAMRGIIYEPCSPMSSPLTPERVLAITRDELLHAHYARLLPEMMHIFLCGKLTPALIDLVAEAAGSITPQGGGFSLRPMPFRNNFTTERRDIAVPGALQSAVRIYFPTIGRADPDFIPLRMACTALGGYFGSRLMSNIREDKGLTYGISSAMLGYPRQGFIAITSQTDTANTEALIAETLLEVERLKDPATYSHEEIDRLRRFVLSQLAATLDTPFARMDFLQIALLAGTPRGYFDMQQQCARALNPEMLATVAARYIHAPLITTAG